MRLPSAVHNNFEKAGNVSVKFDDVWSVCVDFVSLRGLNFLTGSISFDLWYYSLSAFILRLSEAMIETSAACKEERGKKRESEPNKVV